MNKPKDLENVTLDRDVNGNVIVSDHVFCRANIIRRGEIDSVIEYLNSVKEYIEKEKKPKIGDYGTSKGVKYVVREGEGGLILQPLLSWQIFIEATPLIMRDWKKEGNIYENSI